MRVDVSVCVVLELNRRKLTLRLQVWAIMTKQKVVTFSDLWSYSSAMVRADGGLGGAGLIREAFSSDSFGGKTSNDDC